MQNFTQLKKNIKPAHPDLEPVRIALLGDTATQFLVQALQGMGVNYGFKLNIWEAEFDQIDRQIFDSSSELYKFNPEIVIIFHSSHALLKKYNKLKIDQYSKLSDDQISLITSISDAIQEKLSVKIIYYNFPEINDFIFGNFANKIESSFIFQLRKLNYQLMELAIKRPELYICDLSSVQNKAGKDIMFQPSVYINTEMVLSIDILPEVSAKTLDLISAMHGKFKKCLIVDLDNTLWGGIIGDDGIENIQIGNLGIGKAFTEFQYWIKKLKNRGILIAVCSKNTESTAMEVFEKHPDMVLRPEDIAVFTANWNNKVDNIKHIQSILQIAFDSMVFIDDSPFERNMVRENIPGITVPELPEDPADYLEYLYSLNLFETISWSNEDAERTKQYQTEANRSVMQKSFTNEEDFLKSLDMKSVIESFNKYTVPRIAQLSQRSNQFNLRTTRYTETEVEIISKSADYITLSFTLSDKFGDNGLICAIILKKENATTLFIDTWFMSCRVLKRGVENFVLNTLSGVAREKEFTYLKGEYIPTSKNEMVKYHYENLGFTTKENYWLLNLQEFSEKTCFIKPIIK